MNGQETAFYVPYDLFIRAISSVVHVTHTGSTAKTAFQHDFFLNVPVFCIFGPL